MAQLSPELSLETAVLERLKVFKTAKISNEILLQKPQIIAHILGSYIDELVFGLETFIWKEDIGTILVKYPKNWWEAVKDRFLPKWAKKWVLIEYTEIVVKEELWHPDLVIKSDERKLIAHRHIVMEGK